MAYILINIETGDYFRCEDQVWIDAFNAAVADGWKPDGTMFDPEFYLDTELDFVEDETQRYWMIVSAVKETFDWDGNYIEKSGQIVTYGDAYYMVMSLKCAGVDPELIEFVSRGDFRIC